MVAYYLLKSEPEDFPWSKVKAERVVRWDGIRNYQARNYMRIMDIGDLCLFYHSGKDPAVVGIAKVVSKSYQDPADDTGKFLAIDIAYSKDMEEPFTLKAMKNNVLLSEMKIIKQTRLSISPLTELEYHTIAKAV